MMKFIQKKTSEHIVCTVRCTIILKHLARIELAIHEFEAHDSIHKNFKCF